LSDPRDTKDRILDAAELLFSEQGIAATSLRSITQAAGVNVAACHYHFGDKMALVEAIVSRRITPMNSERLARLEQLQAAAGDAPAEVESLLTAYLGPVVAARAQWGESARKVGALMARLRIEQADIESMFAQLDDLHRRYALALAEALPGLDPEEAGERLDHAVGSMIHLLMHSRSAPEAPAGPAAPAELQGRFERMIDFLAAGFRAPSEPKAQPIPAARAEHVRAVGARGARA
jgi:AcrR family transcriptional regulator